MLQIIIIGNGGTRLALELAFGTVLEMEETSPAFDVELDAGTYSLPVEIPWTENNRRILQAPEFLESAPTGNPAFNVDILENGLPVLEARLTLLSHRGLLDYSAGSTSGTVTGTASRFGRALKGKKLPELNWGAPVPYWQPGTDARHWATKVMKEQVQGYNHIGFAPVFMSNFIDSDAPEGLSENMVNKVSQTGSQPWEFNVSSNLQQGDPEYPLHRTVPFLQLFWVLAKVAAAGGCQAQGEFLADPHYRFLHLFSNYALERYNSQREDANRALFYENHVPPVLVVDFLMALQNTFNLYLEFPTNGLLSIRSRNRLLTAPGEDFTPYCDANFETLERTSFGAKLEWQWDGADSLVGEQVHEDALKKVRASLRNFGDLVAWSPANSPQEGDIVYLINQNFYVRFDAVFGWSYYSEGQLPYTTKEGESKFPAPVSPLLTGIYSDPSQGVNNSRYCAAAGNAGSYYNSQGKLVKKDFGLRLFYIQRWQTGAPANRYNEPASFVNALADAGDLRVRTGLSWNGPNGLVEKEWKPWLRALDEGVTVKANFRGKVPPFGEPIFIKGVKYLVKQRRRKIGAGQETAGEMELLRL